MKRFAGLLRLQVCAMVGAMVLVPFLAGCPDIASLIPGLIAGPLTLTASTSGEPTVDKTINLIATVEGGTAPYTYAWAQKAGPVATVNNATAATANFVPTAAGMYTFAVTVTDSSVLAQSLTSQIEIPVGDIQFVIPGAAGVRISGNPALIVTNTRAGIVEADARVSVFDPLFLDDQTTDMTVTYELVSVPTGARAQDVSLDREFDSISNQGTGDMDYSTVDVPSLDGVVGLQIRSNPSATLKVLTNLATVVENYGTIVPGDYVFRATVTNPAGWQRTRDLTLTISLEGATTITWGGSADGGAAVSAGPAAVKVKQLPEGSPGRVTDKVMMGDQTATMTVTVFPTTATYYRFYLVDNNDVALPDYVTQDMDEVDGTGSPQDIVLTIGSTAGMVPATYTLAYETFDALGARFAADVTVNAAATPVRFHVTEDFLEASMINAALVGAASNDIVYPTDYEGWSGDPATAEYTTLSALVDVDLDEAMDILTVDGNTLKINYESYHDGSTAGLRHPSNAGNFGPALPAPITDVAIGFVPTALAVGDLNGDALPDVAVNNPAGGVKIFFHTGDPLQPYSEHADQTLQIQPPATDRMAYDSTTLTFAAAATGAAPAAGFGWKLGIWDQNADGAADLIVTDPGFSKVHVLNVADPGAPAIAPAAANAFYLGHEGRVYAFAGGATGNLKPGRPVIVTSLITEREISSGAAPAFPTAPAYTVSFAETATKYALAYEGGELDEVGFSLSNAGGAGFAVGSEFAARGGTKEAVVQIVDAVADGDWLDIEVQTPGPGGGTVLRRYEFDTNAAVASTYGGVANGTVDISADASGPAALVALVAAINAEAAGQNVVTAVQDTTVTEQAHILYNGTAVDASARLIRMQSSFTATTRNGVMTGGAPVNTPTWVTAAQNADGVVYLVAFNQAAGALTTPIAGTANSDMGFGARLAMGAFNAAASANDLAVAANDPGTVPGVTNDGAVFVLMDGSTTLPTSPITDVGATTLRSGGYGGTDLTPTGVGRHIGFGDVNGDGLEELFFSEPGFDRIYMIKGAATPATKPDITFVGVVFDDSSTPPMGEPSGGSLGNTGTFLFGDVNGDTETDWLFLDTTINFGFAGFERD